MARRSHGLRSKTRKKLSSKKIGLTLYLQEFKVGDKVHLVINPASRKIPHPKFHGKTGVVKGKKGRAYVVAIEKKYILAKPEHLKKVGE